MLKINIEQVIIYLFITYRLRWYWGEYMLWYYLWSSECQRVSKNSWSKR